MIKSYGIDKVADAAKLALKNRLYVNGWCMREDYLSIINCGNNWTGNRRYQMYMKFEGSVPIAAAIVEYGFDWYKKQNTGYSTIQIYVRATHRRKGIGSELVAAAKKDFDGPRGRALQHGEGVVGSCKFWDKVF